MTARVRKPAVHRLRTWVPYFQAVIDGAKPFEVRRDDRGFQVGDRVRLIEVTHPDDGLAPTGREAEAEITYILSGGQFGIEPGYAVLGLDTGTGMPEDDPHAP
jgi:hypothetical protein